MRCFLLFVAVLITGMVSTVEAQPATAPSDDRVAKLEAEIRKLAERLQQAETKIVELEKTAKTPAAENKQIAWPDAADMKSRVADRAALAKINLPANPTRDQVIDYIRAIELASANQNTFSTVDPQIRKLAAVGADHIDLLLETDQNIQFYSTQAIAQLARDQDRDLILGAMSDRPDLVQIVVAKRWQKEARPILLEKLGEQPEYLPPDWVKAVISLKEPAANPLLVDFLIRSSNRDWNYEMLRNVPGLAFDEKVAAAWPRARREDNPNNGSMARLAARCGVKEALVRIASRKGISPNTWEQQHDADVLSEVTNYDGDADGMANWVKDHQAELTWDSKQRIFVLPAAAPK